MCRSACAEAAALWSRADWGAAVVMGLFGLSVAFGLFCFGSAAGGGGGGGVSWRGIGGLKHQQQNDQSRHGCIRDFCSQIELG